MRRTRVEYSVQIKVLFTQSLEMKMYSVVAVFLVIVSQVHGHTYHLKDCPNVEAMKDFDINRFLGKWYVIQKTATGSSCLVNNYVADENNPGQYKIEQVSENFLSCLTTTDHKYHYTGTLTIPHQERAAEMKVQFPLNVAGGASYTVFMTDYDTYAGIFTCQRLAFAHRRSATIISRTKNLDKKYIDKIRDKLESFGVDPSDLSIINQNNCTEPALNGVNEGTLTADHVVEVFKKAGEKIGDGFEVVADSAKKVFTKVRGDHEDSKEEFNAHRDMKADAEWLP